MLYKMLIVDDEPHVLDGLIQIFNRFTKYELDILSAMSAEDALEIVENIKIDLMITDIRMGSMSGLELADKAALMWKDIRIVFLTAYNDFDYAYEAIKKKNAKYILKTESDEVLADIVTELFGNLAEETGQRLYVEDMKKELNQLTCLLRKETFKEIIEGSSSISRELKNKLPDTDLTIKLEMPMLIVGSRILSDTSHDIKDIMEIFRCFFADTAVAECFPWGEQDILVWLIQPTDLKHSEGFGGYVADSFRTMVKGYLEPIQNNLKERLDINTAFVIGSTFVKRDSIKQDLMLIHKTLTDCNMKKDSMVIIDLQSFDKSLMDSLSKEQSTIERINSYIEKNIGGDISLTQIARTIYFNPSYMSRYYKMLTGKNIIDYINEVKFRVAKELLINTQKKISEIGLMVGFRSPSYFTAFFKKMENQSPKEYRSKISGE